MAMEHPQLIDDFTAIKWYKPPFSSGIFPGIAMFDDFDDTRRGRS